MEKARLIIDRPAVGSWNMAVDHALLETAHETGLISLRFYEWSEPTLSLGYFQNHADRELHRPSNDCAMVRRTTGGGAIVHDNEITYSLCVPSANRWSKSNEQLYYLVHQIIIDLLAKLDIAASLFGSSGDDDQQESFLCFQRRANGDVIAVENKICGSAQRRKKNALLQHGSILLGRAPQAPELPGIQDMFPQIEIRKDNLIDSFGTTLGEKLGVHFDLGGLTENEISAAENAKCGIYALDTWNYRR